MSEKPRGKLIIIVAPSGSGKTTIARMLLDNMPEVRFSVSATTRPPRPGEEHGKDYFFLSDSEFEGKIEEGGFLEWEFYNGNRYGTLRSEVDKLIDSGYFPLLDIEVNGALNVKRMYGSDSVSVFIQPPSLDELEERLRGRGTESSDSLASRLKQAESEMQFANRFDYIVVNDKLDHAFSQVKKIIELFIADKI